MPSLFAQGLQPPASECTFTGKFAAGYQPGAVVVYNGPRPMVVYSSKFLQTLP